MLFGEVEYENIYTLERVIFLGPTLPSFVPREPGAAVTYLPPETCDIMRISEVKFGG